MIDGARATYGSTFSGILGLDLAVEAIFDVECRFACDSSAFCREVIAARRPDVQIYDDIRAVNRHSAPRVDLVCGGFPCQDVSAAGRRVGLELGARTGLWRELQRVIAELGPDVVVLENVPGLLGRGLDIVLGSLAALGFDAEWDCVRASDVGAPHRRDRLFVLAYRDRESLRKLTERKQLHAALGSDTESRDTGAHEGVADTDSAQWGEGGTTARGERGTAEVGARLVPRGVKVADRDGERRQSEGELREAQRRSVAAGGGEALADGVHDGRGELGPREHDDADGGMGPWSTPGRLADGCDAGRAADHRWPPGPDDAEGWARWTGARPSFRRSPHGLPRWVDNARVAEALRRARLRALGNAVVRQQAEYGIRQLAVRALRIEG